MLIDHMDIGGLLMHYEQILYNIEDGIATITLNRPERLNAWTRVMAREVMTASHRAEEDDNVRVIILTGAGRGFCAGADMAELEGASDEAIASLKSGAVMSAERRVSLLMDQPTEAEYNPENKDRIRDDFRKRYSYLMGIRKPVIAAINGPAAGLGLIIALYCDIRFASDKARFSTAFSKRGLIAEHGISWILPKITGLPNALDMLYSSRIVEAQDAFRIGLVNKVIPAESFMDSVMAYAKDLAGSVSPRSMGVIKKQVYNAMFQSLDEASEVADEELLQSLTSEDFKEGVAHFLEKRLPDFTGK
jgi:enoyl-CoA hydratase/carnithine racemase